MAKNAVNSGRPPPVAVDASKILFFVAVDASKKLFAFMGVFALQSVDFASQKGIATKKSLPPVKVFSFFVKVTTAIFFLLRRPNGG